jgi:hypothetical protein
MYEETPQPTIIRACKRCALSDEDVARGYVVVSPTGLAHHGADYGMTECGIDATGDAWWWPL